jgi:uncharacterized iron-regulated membrane protein
MATSTGVAPQAIRRTRRRHLPARQVFVLIHRYVGLVLAGFLLIAGLTGALLAFYHELDRALNPQVRTVTPPSSDARPIDPLVLREQIQARYPEAWVHWVDLAPEPGRALSFWIEGPTDPLTGKHADIANDEVFVDPYTGGILGERKWGDITQGLTNVMPFIYRLHYTLALGTVGTYAFGIVALLWTLDCFVGACLTFPVRRRSGADGTALHGKMTAGWWRRWWPAWLVRWHGSQYQVTFDLHRAGGLWPWALLFVLAWSAVGFNLQEVYKPVMGALFSRQQGLDHLPKLAQDRPNPGLPWAQAREVGRRLMAQEAQAKGFTVIAEKSLSYDPHKGVYRYRVKSDRDLAERWGSTAVYFDATTGERRAAYIPTGEAMGDTLSTWLFALHMAAVGGLPFRLLISVMGLAVAGLSVTGVLIWWRKHVARVRAKQLQHDPSRHGAVR